ncbi:GNAT family N-acetyltransferase [Aeromicrobium sp. CnD17-E]|uniref:GNAT family N-acetyltransferase n=1 Tax=Aeromicrobium sp. CnD17-E TaxID=2954487 RepID=UPI002096E1C0|nr:GNAT family N-acetyltransferase [Aeromicrobium sp. CnD17-E]MCO7238537.1 GNAT family N-acetyltransferase [Aeromicrobium sp. CnD17-E]
MWCRQVGVDDAPDVAVLLGELGYPTTVGRVTERLRKRPSTDDAAWVAVTRPGGEVIGFAAAHTFWPYELDHPVAELTALVVSAQHRRAGAGGALVDVVEQWADARGCVRLTVASALDRHGAHAFYAGRGYAQLAKKLEKSLPST